MAWKALIDGTGKLTGFDRTGEADGIEVPAGCDLEPGRYRWNDVQKRFDPLPRLAPGAEIEPSALGAIHAGFEAIDTRFPGLLPAATRRWMRQFGKTMDGITVAVDQIGKGRA